MENGDRQKVLQHRLLGIFPDDLDFQRIVAWSVVPHVPTAVHVSDGHRDFKRCGAVMGDNFGFVLSAPALEDTSVTLLFSAVT